MAQEIEAVLTERILARGAMDRSCLGQEILNRESGGEKESLREEGGDGEKVKARSSKLVRPISCQQPGVY